MSRFQDQPDTDNHADTAGAAILSHLETYWRSLCAADRIPARNDLAPDLIDAALPYAFILHRVAPGIARFRMAGQRINALVRMDARGMPFSILFAPASRSHIAELVETAFMRPAIIGAGLVSPAQILRAPVTARMLLLPLRDAQGQTTRMLGALVSEGILGPTARRFDLAHDLSLRIDSLSGLQKPDAIRPALRLVVNNG